MTAKVTPSLPGAPSLRSASAYAACRVSSLQAWTYKPQKRQDGSAFALTYSLRLKSCRLMGAFVISPLPPVLIQASCAARFLCSAGVTPLHCYCEPRRHRLVFHPFPGGNRLSDVPLLPPISRPGRGRLLQLLGLPLLSCRLYHPAGVTCLDS